MTVKLATSSVMHPTVQTSTGHYIDLTNPEEGYYSVYDIAHALGNLCRFNGHCRSFYSVAQHSVYVARAVPAEHALSALFHDAAEAYLGDMTSPLKALLPEYRKLEHRIEAALRRALNLPAEQHPCIKAADLSMLATEQRDLMPRLTTPWRMLEGRQPYGFRIEPVAPWVAATLFIDTYNELSK